MSTVKVDLQGLERLASQLEQAQDKQDDFYRDTIKELAARLLTKWHATHRLDRQNRSRGGKWVWARCECTGFP